MLKNMNMVGFVAFIVGLILAVIAGIWFFNEAWVVVVLLLLGLLVGFINIPGKDATALLIAIVAVFTVGNVFASVTALDIGTYVGKILAMAGALIGPAAFVVAAKTIWAIGKGSKS